MGIQDRDHWKERDKQLDGRGKRSQGVKLRRSSPVPTWLVHVLIWLAVGALVTLFIRFVLHR